MIKVTRLNNKEFFVNAELILYVEEKPDTIITLTNGEVFTVKESAEQVVERIIDYKRKILKEKK